MRLPVVHEAWLAELANELRLRRTAVGVVHSVPGSRASDVEAEDAGLRRTSSHPTR